MNTKKNEETEDDAPRKRRSTKDDELMTPAEKRAELQNAEALSRRDESRANVMRGRAHRMGDDYREGASKADKELAESSRRLEETRERGTTRDMSGTAPTMSDSAGNYAPNPEVANTGGTLVESSNTSEGGGQAQSAEDVDLSPAGVGVTDHDKLVGDPEKAAELEGTRGAATRPVGTRPSDRKKSDDKKK